MAVDKNLFMYNLAVVSMLKNEAPYVKEWLDYHLLAGVEHFYIYDDESSDNLKEVLQPYIDAEIVTYHKTKPLKNYFARQQTMYNEAVQKYKFFCRYMAFIDVDEFIFPKNHKSVVEVTDEILKDKPNAGGLAINWQIFGSNYLEKADYSKGVLERFTRRAKKDYHKFSKDVLFSGNRYNKTITNPRRVHLWDNPHRPIYFGGFFDVNENNVLNPDMDTTPASVEKIAIYHYYVKSYEECCQRRRNLDAETLRNWLKICDRNEVFDDSILAYRDARLKMGGVTLKPLDYEKLTATLIQNLAPTLNPNVPAEFFEGKLETFLTCRAVCSYLKEFLTDKESGRILEETALNAIQKNLHTNNISMTDANLLIAELPKILPLNYPVVQDIRKDTINIISTLKDLLLEQIENEKVSPDRMLYRGVIWKNWKDFNYILEMLKTFEAYQQK